MLNKFRNIIASGNLFSSKDSLIIAASGGLDSTVLAELCHRANFRFTLAHCNFRLRGEESDRDDKFVHKLGEKYGCEVLVRKFDTEKIAAERKLSIQEAARALRYDWFHELSTGEGSPLILTAHHRDDSIETLLMHFFRGTGLSGLTGIPLKNGAIRRPLLHFYREEMEKFARENELEWMEDSSNQSSKYTRNYFRNELIPSIEKVFPRVRQNLAGNIDRFLEIEKLYKEGSRIIRAKLLKQKGNEWHVPVKQLLQQDNRALVYELINEFGFGEKQVEELIRLGQSDSGRYIQSPAGDWRIIRHRHWFIIAPVSGDNPANLIIEKDTRSVSFNNGRIDIKVMSKTEIDSNADHAYVNGDLLKYPLLLRKRKTGDYFYPLGMTKKKKLSRFFIDQKLSALDKENAWVIENGDGRIVWVIGMRIDERFKVREGGRVVLFSFSR